MSRPVKDHLWRWSKIFRSDLTKMVRSAWFLTWFPEFWTEWKARSCKILSHMESTLKRCSHSRQPLSVVDPGEGPGRGPGPPYFWTKLRPEGPKKNFFSDRVPLISGSGWPPPLSEGLMTFDIANLNCSCWTVELVFLSIAANRHFLLWFCGLQLQRLHLNCCYNSYIAIKNDCTIQISLELVLLAVTSDKQFLLSKFQPSLRVAYFPPERDDWTAFRGSLIRTSLSGVCNLRSGVIFIYFLLLCFFGSRRKK